MTQVINEHFIASVLSLWNMGFDTYRMAAVLQCQQSEAERALHIGLEDRRRKRERKSYIYDDGNS